MKIICGYVAGGLSPKTEAALRRYAPQTEMLDFTGQEYGYWNAILSRWTGKQDLVIIEQDNIITESTIKSLQDCDDPWCCFGYKVPEISGVKLDASLASSEWTQPFLKLIGYLNRKNRDGFLCTGLGCTKFSSSLQRDFPLTTDHLVKWDVVDETISNILADKGIKPHVHGKIGHVHSELIACLHNDPDPYFWHYEGYSTFMRHKILDGKFRHALSR